jgi:hypothetical protein
LIEKLEVERKNSLAPRRQVAKDCKENKEVGKMESCEVERRRKTTDDLAPRTKRVCVALRAKEGMMIRG